MNKGQFKASIEAIIEQIKREGVKTQSGERCVDLPSVKNLDAVRDYLKYSKKALQELLPIFNVFLQPAVPYTNPRYDKLCDETRTRYGENDPITIQLKKDHDGWLKQVVDLRNEDEHPTKEQLYRDFDISWNEPEQKWTVTPPKFFDGTRIDSLVTVSTRNIFTFAEDMNILFLGKVLPGMVELNEIPEAERKPECEVRYRIGLKQRPS